MNQKSSSPLSRSIPISGRFHLDKLIEAGVGAQLAQQALHADGGQNIYIDGDMRRGGIQLYELVNWYRYLNCGYQVPLTGGTDKMAAYQAIGHVRVYSKLAPVSEFTYDEWMDSVRCGNTFVTFGPLSEFAVDGNEAGSATAQPIDHLR